MKNKNKNIIVALILIFIIPVIVSKVIYHYHYYFHFKTTNHGMFIKPPIVIPKTKTWQIVYMSTRTCGQFCLKTQHNLNQIKLALGKNSLRVTVIFLDSQMQKKLMHAFYLRYQNKFNVFDKIYLVDPEGNVFMHYPSHTDPMNILKDLKHLLEVSQIG